MISFASYVDGRLTIARLSVTIAVTLGVKTFRVLGWQKRGGVVAALARLAKPHFWLLWAGFEAGLWEMAA